MGHVDSAEKVPEEMLVDCSNISSKWEENFMLF